MNKRLLFIAGATTLLSAAVVATSFFATNRNFASTNAGDYIDPNPDPIEVVTPTTLTYDDFDWGKIENHTEFWVTSPNGNKIGIYLGGNCAIGGEYGHGELTLVKDEGAYVDTRGLTTDPSARKYAFSQIKSINVSFTATAYLQIQYFDGEFHHDEHIDSNSDLNLSNSNYFKLYPSSGSVTITSIRVTYNSTGDFCN